MKRDVVHGLRWLAWGVAGLLLIVALVWLASRLRGAPAEQRAALATMQAPWTPTGRDAFDAVWLLHYDVPEAARAAIVAQDLGDGEPGDPQQQPDPADSVAGQRHPRLEIVPGDVAPCAVYDRMCLAQVIDDVDAYAALVAANARLVRNVEALEAYGHYRSRPAVRMVPDRELAALGWPLTANAVRFAKGDHDTAVAGVCRGIDTMRRLGAQSDALVLRVSLSVLVTDGYAPMLADMLARLPASFPLPPACGPALAAPGVDEASTCNALRGEFAMVADGIRGIPDAPGASWADEALGPLLFDGETTLADLAARRLAPACGADADAALQADRPVVSPPPRTQTYTRFECIANALGCVLADIGGEHDYIEYRRRMQDHRARLQVLATMAWLRTQPADGPLDARIAGRPLALRSPARGITPGTGGRSLQIAQYAVANGDTWSLPLPPYLVESPAASD